jgi:hypothetical protein
MGMLRVLHRRSGAMLGPVHNPVLSLVDALLAGLELLSRHCQRPAVHVSMDTDALGTPKVCATHELLESRGPCCRPIHKFYCLRHDTTVGLRTFTIMGSLLTAHALLNDSEGHDNSCIISAMTVF